MLRNLPRIFLSALACLLAGAPVEAKTVRVATFNIENGPDAPGTTDYNATKAIVQRVNADVVAFQEVDRNKASNWQQMATELGYTNVHLGTTNSAGGLLGYFSRWPLVTTNLSSVAPANEFTRRPMRAVVQVPGAAKPLVLWNMHHKADDFTPTNTPANQFRRAIEAHRIVQDINAYRSNNPTHTELVMMGDLNENIFGTNAETLGQINTAHQSVQFSQSEYNTLRSNTVVFADSYQLGADITFPVPYQTFPDTRYGAAGLQRLNLRQQNGEWTGTRGGRYVALDYILVSAPLTTGAAGEIYNSIHEPAGLPKAGTPLATNTSDLASDHFAVFADIQMQDATNSLTITPSNEVRVTGSSGGPFSPASTTYTLSNPGAQPASFTVSSDASWLVPQVSGGTVPGNGSTNIVVSVNAAAAPTTPAEYVGRITVNGVVRAVRLVVLSPVTDYLTQHFTTGVPFNLANRSVTFTPDGSVNFYRGTIATVSAFPVNPDGGTTLPLGSLDSREVLLTGGKKLPLFGVEYTRFFVGSAGYITFTAQDLDYSPSVADHFAQPRISGLFFDLDPTGASVSYKQLSDRVAATYRNVPQFGAATTNNFQIEMFFDGRIRLTWLGVGAVAPALGAAPPLVGLSPGGGRPAQFFGSVFSSYPATPAETPYEAFVRSYGLDPSASGAPGVDHDKDGFSNWTEFAFGGSPVAADASLFRAPNAAAALVFTFLGRTQGVTYTVEKSSGLGGSFSADSSTIPVTSADQSGVASGWTRRQFSVPADGAAFYRLRAAEN
jgi:endonuclease/exonuclease/phosphatase family metal-dependent hydrolase